MPDGHICVQIRTLELAYESKKVESYRTGVQEYRSTGEYRRESNPIRDHISTYQPHVYAFSSIVLSEYDFMSRRKHRRDI